MLRTLFITLFCLICLPVQASSWFKFYTDQYQDAFYTVQGSGMNGTMVMIKYVTKPTSPKILHMRYQPVKFYTLFGYYSCEAESFQSLQHNFYNQEGDLIDIQDTSSTDPALMSLQSPNSPIYKLYTKICKK